MATPGPFLHSASGGIDRAEKESKLGPIIA